jgi:hypothetical protein
MKRTEVVLDSFEEKLAMKIGDGDVCLGIRRAIVLTGLRMEGTAQKGEGAVNQKPDDQLTMVTNQMAALAAQLKEAADNPSREEIGVQLVRLGKLYLSIQAGGGSSLDDR